MAARIDLALTLSRMMDPMIAGIEETGVLVPLFQFAAMLQLQSYRPLHLEG